MAIATFRGEQSVGEIADRFFARLTPKQREMAEAALLKANPQLRKIDGMREGTILRIPDLPMFRAKPNRGLENPEAQIARNLSQALGDYGQRLGERVKQDAEGTKQQLALLKSAKLKRVLAAGSELQALADSAGKALNERARSIDERQKALDTAFQQAQAALKARQD